MMKQLKYGAPRWLVEALGEKWRDGQSYDLLQLRAAGFDHVRTYRGCVAISQTYEANGAELGQTLVKLAELDIRMRVWGISPYFPGRTFSLVMWRGVDEALADEVMEKMHAPFARLTEQPKTAQQWI